MVIQTRPARQELADLTTVSPLEAGDHLDLAEFRRRYHGHPQIRKAELIDGVVYMPSPVRLDVHAAPHAVLITWMGTYAAATPGTRVAANASDWLGDDNEVQPDALLMVLPESGGQLRHTPDDYLEGAPELVVEVAASSAAYDLHEKRRAFARAGVREYLIAQSYERGVLWLTLHGSEFVPLESGADGVLRSQVFPGLWLQPDTVWSGDLAGLLATLQAGLATDEHAAFVAALQQSGGAVG